MFFYYKRNKPDNGKKLVHVVTSNFHFSTVQLPYKIPRLGPEEMFCDNNK